ncbi:MAG: prephenate dehydrogenase/arogenate dehydrogenase family protein [Acidimicrobiales bacterium]
MKAHVVGLGLVGSSIGLGLRAKGFQVSGADLDQGRAFRALELGAIDQIGDGAAAGIVFVATPAAAVVPVARALLDQAVAEDRQLVVTDVAGVKGPIAAQLADACFVPGHPMAGSEQEGPDGADGDLFLGATWVLTPTEHTAEGAYSVVREAVTALGADVVVLAPELHDELVAVVSHVPHLASAALMSLAAESALDREALMRLAAGGFRDMTRIAAGSASIWPDICRDNANAIVPALDRLIGRLGEVRRIVAESDRAALMSLLEGARAARQNLPLGRARPIESLELRVVVPDRPGVLADVTSIAGRLRANIYDIEIAHSAEGPRGVLVLVVAASAARELAGSLRQAGYLVAMATTGKTAAAT